MAELGFNFRADSVVPAQESGPIAPGKYGAVIRDSEVRETRAEDGAYLELAIEILSGSAKGRMIWDRLNIRNRSERAQQYALSRLSAVARAVGVATLSDSQVLHDRPLVVAVRHDTRDGVTRNVVAGYYPRSEPVTQAKAAATPPPPPPPVEPPPNAGDAWEAPEPKSANQDYWLPPGQHDEDIPL